MSLRPIKTGPTKPKKREKLTASSVAWTELVPYVHDIEERLAGIEKRQDQLLFLLAQIAKDVDMRRKDKK